MRSVLAWCALGALLACQRGDSRTTLVATDALSTCPLPDETTFVLHYDARDGSVQAAEPGRYPMGGQRIVLCVESPDFRDVYDVTTRREILGDEDEFEARTLELGDLSSEAPVRETETTEGVVDGRAPGLSQAVADATSFVEQVRWQVVQRIRDAYGEPLTAETFARLRDDVRQTLRPLDREGRCVATEGRPETAEPARCSLEQYVNRYELPAELHIVAGEAFWFATEGNEPVRVESTTPMPETLRLLLRRLLSLFGEIEELESFSESLFQATVRPRLVFDVGRFGEDRLVTITVSRHRRSIQVEDRVVKATWARQVSVHQQEVHGLTYFRVEPGFAFSALRRPEYAIGPNDLGDRVIRVEDEGRRVFHPTVFASFYWCGVDVRASPVRRACPAIRSRGLARLVPLLPTLTIGIPIDETLVSGDGNLFVGALFNWIPYVSIGLGAHLGFGVSQLRDGYRVGDPVSFSSTDLAAFTRGGTSVAPYVSITIAPDAFAALTGFKSD
jgi:hypothetical protein